MYFSKLHENVVFDTWYPGPYTLYGSVITVGAPVGYKRRVSVCAGDLDVRGRMDVKEYKTLVIESSVCAVEKGVIEAFHKLKDLIVEADLPRIPITAELETLLKSTRVVVS